MSAKERPGVVKAQLEKDSKTNPPRVVFLTRAEAEKRWGVKLTVGALGVVVEGEDKFRLIHDGTPPIHLRMVPVALLISLYGQV